MKNVKNIFMYCILSVVSAIIIGSILMIAVYSLPTNKIKTNIGKSIDIFNTENDNYYWAYWISGSHLDNFTDAIMLSNAVYDGDQSTVEKAMLNPRTEYEGFTRSESLVENIEDNIKNNGYIEYYARYWHGYLVWLKPFLMLFTFSDWRMFSMIFQSLMLFFVLHRMTKILNEKISFCYLIMMIAMNPISSALSMQYACIYNIILVASYILLVENRFNDNNIWKLFLWVGISTAFFDFLTFPVVPIGILLILYSLLNKRGFKENLRITLICSIVWCIGYGAMWFGKWVVASALTGQNIIMNSLSNVAARMYGDPYQEAQLTTLNVFYVIAKNVHKYLNAPMIILALLLSGTAIWFLFIKKLDFRFKKNNLIYLFVGGYPIVWYCIVRNHSAIHSWMVHRDLTVLIFACLVFFCESITQWDSKKTNLLEENYDENKR